MRLGDVPEEVVHANILAEIRAQNVCGMQLKVGMVKMFMIEQLQAASFGLCEGL